ncbi:MAG: threonine--tRNA ligase [Nanobdellota archaeon]
MVELTFPDGSKKQFEDGITGMQVAQDISEGLARQAIAIKLDGVPLDLTQELTTDGTIQLLTFRDPEGVEIFRHSSAHLLAQAVKRLYPSALPTIGPAVDEGFYYDFDNLPISMEDFDKIEAEMKKIAKEAHPTERIEYSSKEEAKKAFINNTYKQEMIDEMPDEKPVTAYKQGEFIDLCRGPHVPNTKMLKAVKLTKLAGAYWRGNAENKQLTRIYGISFPDKKLLKEHLKKIEEAQKRDHRKIGKQLDLFSFHPEAPGMPFFHDKGTFIWNQMADFMSEEMRKRDYEMNKTPMILNKSLWLQSGHWNHYKENMYFTNIDEQEYAVKPMNCPGNVLVFKSNMHSYKELPIRAGEFGVVHRHELSGVLSGMFRVRFFTQDDAHVFCTRDQIGHELDELVSFIDKVYSTFGFDYTMELSTKPEKAMGEQKLWDLAEQKLEESLEKTGKEYTLNPGDGAFYGPKIDFHLKDALGRTWQCGTIQLDFQMPEKFDLTYEGQDGTKHRPVMIHRAIYGSFERFLGILVEHYAGKFPLWLSPNQVRILPIADRHAEYAGKLRERMKEKGLRVEVDDRSESIKKKVRDAQLQQFNYILVVGDKEIEDDTVTVRTRNNEIRGTEKVDEFINSCKQEIDKKYLE